VLTSLEPLRFEAAWERRVPATYDGVPIAVLGIDGLLANKRAAGRPQDRLEVENLERARRSL